jgi:hypothetical protein
MKEKSCGNVQVADDNVRLEVTLPWLLYKFGEAMQKRSAGAGASCPRSNRAPCYRLLVASAVAW